MSSVLSMVQLSLPDAGTRNAGLLSNLDPVALLEGLGPAVLLVVALMVFIESGLLFPFLPGDSLLFTAGLLHKDLNVSLPALIGVVMLAAISGDQVGYFLGRRFGRRWFREGLFPWCGPMPRSRLAWPTTITGNSHCGTLLEPRAGPFPLSCWARGWVILR